MNAARHRPAGTTLVELLVATTLAGVLSGAAVVAVVRVRRTAADQTERALARAQLVQAAAVLAHELRAAVHTPGPDDGRDLLEVSDSAIDLRTPVGGSVACTVAPAPGGSTVELAPAAAGVGWWSATPRPGDAALVYDPGPRPGADDDAWRERAVVGATAGGCTTGPFATPGLTATPWRLALAGPSLPATVARGAPVRVLRRRRYALYRGGDAQWALGMREWDATGPAAVQPVAGPFEPPARGGLQVTAWDSTGAPVAPGDDRTAMLAVRLLAGRRRLGVEWRDSARVVVRPAGAGGAP